MKNGAIYFKYASPIISLLIIWAILNELNCGGKGKTEFKEVVKIERDTITKVEVDTFISYVPKPYKEEVIRDSIVYLERQPEYQDIPSIAKRWIEDYHKKAYYDTLIKDQNEYGSIMAVRITDTVYKNKIIGRGIWKHMESTVLKETITLREKPRLRGYVGLEVAGNLQSPIEYTGLSFGFLSKTSTQYIGIKGGLLRNGDAIYGVELKRLIKFKK